MTDRDADLDALLVAYIDGELAPAERDQLDRRLADDRDLRDRLAALEAGQRPFAQAFQMLLADAPAAKLEAMLDAVPQPSASDRGLIRRARIWRPVMAAAALAVAFAAGLLSGDLVRTTAGVPPPTAEDREGDMAAWRQTVAEYQTLFTPEAVASMPDDAETRRQELAAVGGKLGLDLSPETVSFPDLAFKRAQLYGYDGRALAQLTYLDRDGRPVALCIIGNGAPADRLRSETREGMPILYWSKDGRSFMLIGTAPETELRSIAQEVSGRL